MRVKLQDPEHPCATVWHLDASRQCPLCMQTMRSMQVKNLDLGDKGELKKLAQQKEDAGELSASDERKYRSLQRATERELLQVTP